MPQAQIVPTGVHYFVSELANFLSKKGNKEGTAACKMIYQWLDGELNVSELTRLFDGSEYPNSQLNKILLKIVLLPSCVILSFADRCFEKKRVVHYIGKVQQLQENLLMDLKDIPSFSGLFIKTDVANNIMSRQQNKVINEKIAENYSLDYLQSCYQERWRLIHYKGPLDDMLYSEIPALSSIGNYKKALLNFEWVKAFHQ